VTSPGSPLRVVFLLQDLLFGGTQRQALELAHHLDPARFQVELWMLMGGDDLVPVAQGRNLPLVWLSRQPWVNPLSLARLWRRLQRTPVDVLMLLTAVPNIWGRILGRLARVPRIIGNCRGGAAPWRQHERYLWPLADHVICNSLALKQELSRHYRVPPGRLTVIHNGVDLNYFKPPRQAPPAHPPRILTVARLVPDKDHGTLIRAFRLAAAEHPGAELWLVGDGHREQALRQLAAAALPPGQVRFFPGQADLRPFFAQATLFALSSIHEACPNVVLEAMAAGLPVVATRVGGLPELVVPGETGWLVPPGDPAALAAALRGLLADPGTREAFGRAGHRRAARCFPLAAMVRSHEAVLEKLLQGQRPKNP
jgi:glycosyltransferase involved in cell wall biosynthesis